MQDPKLSITETGTFTNPQKETRFVVANWKDNVVL